MLACVQFSQAHAGASGGRGRGRRRRLVRAGSNAVGNVVGWSVVVVIG